MNREDKIKRIYEVIADKTLSFGCGVKCKESGTHTTAEGRLMFHTKSSRGFDKCVLSDYNNIKQTHYNEIIEIIGHPVMIGDVLDWVGGGTYISEDKNDYGYYEIAERAIVDITNLYTQKRNPIEDQSDATISFIYDLISDNK